MSPVLSAMSIVIINTVVTSNVNKSIVVVSYCITALITATVGFMIQASCSIILVKQFKCKGEFTVAKRGEWSGCPCLGFFGHCNQGILKGEISLYHFTLKLLNLTYTFNHDLTCACFGF